MKGIIITEEILKDYYTSLILDEKNPATAEAYTRHAARLAAFLDGAAASRQQVLNFKDHLLAAGLKPATINSIICGLNSFMGYLGLNDCTLKLLKVQRRAFSDPARELTRAEYERLLETAHHQGQDRLGLILETIAATGIRISELRYITAEAARCGRTEIYLKGKVRTIIIPKKLAKKLTSYMKSQKISRGPVFISKFGTPISRKAVWAAMKKLAAEAGVALSKVFPHNLRHLFARSFYKVCGDIARLADVLGHASIETTRLYLISSGAEHVRSLEKMNLIS